MLRSELDYRECSKSDLAGELSSVFRAAARGCGFPDDVTVDIELDTFMDEDDRPQLLDTLYDAYLSVKRAVRINTHIGCNPDKRMSTRITLDVFGDFIKSLKALWFCGASSKVYVSVDDGSMEWRILNATLGGGEAGLYYMAAESMIQHCPLVAAAVRGELDVTDHEQALGLIQQVNRCEAEAFDAILDFPHLFGVEGDPGYYIKVKSTKEVSKVYFCYDNSEISDVIQHPESDDEVPLSALPTLTGQTLLDCMLLYTRQFLGVREAAFAERLAARGIPVSGEVGSMPMDQMTKCLPYPLLSVIPEDYLGDNTQLKVLEDKEANH